MERLDFKVDAYNPVEATIHLTRYLNAKPYVKGMRVLDAACGEGYGSSLMKQWGAKSVVGVDISEEAVQAANSLFAKQNVEFVQHDVQKLPFEDVSFDMVVSLETIEHLNSPEAFLREIKRVVKAGGTIIISCPNDQYYADNVPDFDNPFHKRRYNFFEFREMAERVLGKTDVWYMGNALAGFVNIPLEKCTYPEKSSEAPENMLGMLKTDRLTNTFEVPASKYVNSWNSVYYVGIWGAEESQKNESTAAVFPVPHFFLHQNHQVPDSAKMFRETAELYRKLEQSAQESKEEYIKDKTRLETLLAAQKENSEALLAAQKEDSAAQLRQQEEKLTGELRSLQEAHDTLRQEYNALIEAKEQLTHDIENREAQLSRQEFQALNEAKAQWEQEKESLRDQYAALEEEKRVLTNERDRLYLLNDMQKKTETLQWNRLYDLGEQNKQLFQEHLEYFGLKEAYAKQQDQMADLTAEKERLTEENKQLFQEHLEFLDLRDAYANRQDYIIEILNEKARLAVENKQLFQENADYGILKENYTKQQEQLAGLMKKVAQNEKDKIQAAQDAEMAKEAVRAQMDAQQESIREQLGAEKEALRQQQIYIADMKGFISAQEEAKHQLEEMILKMQNTKGWRALEKMRRFVRGIH